MKRGIIADYIRAHVPRPTELPTPTNHYPSNNLRFLKSCPLGMLDEAFGNTPCDPEDFKPLPPGFTCKRIHDFADWWDRLDDPEKAVKALWP